MSDLQHWCSPTPKTDLIASFSCILPHLVKVGERLIRLHVTHLEYLNIGKRTFKPRILLSSALFHEIYET